jgi:hypothetical protein
MGTNRETVVPAHIAAMIGWTVVLTLLAVKLFKWQ